MAAGNAQIASLKVALGLDSAQFESGLRDASATMQREAKKQAQAAAQLDSRLRALKGSLDPVYAAQKRIGDQMKEAQDLYKKGAIAGAEYGRIMGQLSTRLKQVSTVQAEAAKTSKTLQQAGLNLGRQFSDVGVSLAGGISPLNVLIQQGPQIADAFAQAKSQGQGFGTVVKDLGGAVGRFLASWGPVIAIGGAVAGVFLLWRKHLDDVKAAMAATAAATKALAEVQSSARDALAGALEFTEKYGVANRGLTKSLDDVLVAQNSTYGQVLAGIAANDDAARSAARRAEIERLLAVSLLKRASAEATARAAESDKAAKSARGPARTSGLVVAFGLAGDPQALAAAQAAEAAKFRKLGGEAALAAAKQEREYAKTLNATADALLKAKLVAPEAAKATRDHGSASAAAARAVTAHAEAQDGLEQSLRRVLDSLQTPMEKALADLNEKTLILRAGLDAGKLSTEEFRAAIERLFPAVVEAADAQKVWRVELEKTPADIKPAVDQVKSLREVADDLARSFDDVAYSFGGIGRAFKTGNFSRLIGDVLTLKDGIASLLSQGLQGTLSLGSAVAGAIGGKGGRAIGGALGIGGGILGLGSLATANALPAVGALTGVLGVGGAGAVGGALAAFGAAAPPLAVAAAALYAAAKLFNIGGQPSNKGAGFDLRTGAISGNKRNEETDQAARSAGEAILGIQDSLKAAGIGLNDAVVGLVIGTRDQTQIYLESGKTLRSAVGDAGAAVDTALKALLTEATYVSDAQKTLVQSALAAGKGFDAIAEILSAYEAAQKIGAGLADRIQQLTNPQQFDIDAVKRGIEDQRKAFADLAKQGYLTAEQLAGLNLQLTTLQGLELDEVMKRYAEAVAVPPAVNDNSLETLGQAADAAADGLRGAYGAFADAKRSEIDQLRQAAAGLRDFQRDLTFGSTAGRAPGAQLDLLRREFGRISGLTPTDPDRLASLQGVGQAFVEASRAGSGDELSFRRDLAAVRRATGASAAAADSQADIAQAQLDAATRQLTQLGLLTEVTRDMATALRAYLAANANLKAGGGDPVLQGFNAAAYLAANPDLGQNWTAGGSLHGVGATLEDALAAHYKIAGQYEIAAGKRTRGFATGGAFKVGGPGGIDSQLMQFWASPGEMVSVSHGDPQANTSAELRGLREQVATLTSGLAVMAGRGRRIEKYLSRWDGGGLPEARDLAVGS